MIGSGQRKKDKTNERSIYHSAGEERQRTHQDAKHRGLLWSDAFMKVRLKFSATPHRDWAKEFIVWSFGERERDRRKIDLEIDSRLDSRDRRRLRSQISARDSALVREFLDSVESKPTLG
ncbi:hypothetical protein AVEN_8901-1 [Araneus ventricosus]|uniref:Uncharacterized protein n=1 Tax=Araneus ventricosus TaxID=182803 RepID=A0A4Y2DH21_ARAVE|nr:hypothetical protein AVEN_8901-1 [Araneus ventricosus]